MGCSPNTTITWSAVYAIAERIDELAETLNTPGYTPLADVEDMPFKFATLVDFSGAIAFGVTAGTTVVTAQHLSDGVMLTAPHDLDPVLDEMGKNSDLYLVVEEDDCWCKTLFKIDTNPGVPRVKEVTDGLGCCQSLFVPQPGQMLDYGQHIVPAGYVSQYAANGNPEDGSLWQVRPACRIETVDSGFKFLTVELEAPLTHCTREISDAKFTWPMRKSYMAKMIEKLNYILDCANSGGAAADAIKTGQPAPDDYVQEGCEVTLCMLVRDRVERGLMNYSSDGCVSQGCDDTDNDEPSAYPWDTPTCGGSNCEDKGPKYYCRTIQDLEAILDIAEVGLRPREEPTVVCVRCTCQVVFEMEGSWGVAETCLSQYDEDEFFLEYTNEFRYKQWDTDATCTVYNITVWTDASYGSNICGTDSDPLPWPGCYFTERYEGDPNCPPEDEDDWYVDEYLGYVSLIGPASSSHPKAMQLYSDCTWIPWLGAYAANFDEPGQAEVAAFRWRLRLDGSWNCGEETPASFTKDVRTVTTGAAPGTAVTTHTLAWDALANTMASPWVTVGIPPMGNRRWVELAEPAATPCLPTPCYQIG